MKYDDPHYDLSSHMNGLFSSFHKDVFIIERSKVEKKLDDLSHHILKDFLANEEYFMQILEMYENVSEEIGKLKEVLGDLSSVSGEDSELKKVLAKYIPDAKHLARDRELVEYGFLKVNGKDGMVMIMTDVIIIAEKGEEVFEVKHLLTHEQFSIREQEDGISLEIPGKTIILDATPDVMDRLLVAVDAIERPVLQSRDELDLERIEFLVFTERYDILLEEIQKKKNSSLCLHPKKIYNEENLHEWKNLLGKNFYQTLSKLLTTQFHTRLRQLDKELDLKEYISEGFNLFYEFFNQEKNLAKNLNEPMVLIVEDQLTTLIEHLGKRIFFHRRKLQEIKESLQHIQEKLKWENNDFTHLLTTVKNKREEAHKRQEQNLVKKLEYLIDNIRIDETHQTK